MKILFLAIVSLILIGCEERRFKELKVKVVDIYDYDGGGSFAAKKRWKTVVEDENKKTYTIEGRYGQLNRELIIVIYERTKWGVQQRIEVK